MERFEIIVNGWKPLTIITKRSILDVAVVLDPPVKIGVMMDKINQNRQKKYVKEVIFEQVTN